MKHNAGNRRSRNRSGGKRPSGGGGGRNNFESNGPEVKVRGTAQQVLEKYLALARDAASAGDRIKSESYFQFAEHYYRIANADGSVQGRRDGPGVDANGPQPDITRAGQDASDDGAEDYDGIDDDERDDDVRYPRDNQARNNDAHDSRGDKAGGSRANKTGETRAEKTDETRDDSPAVDRIDEAVLPAAVPTPPRRRRARAKTDDTPDVAGEPEVVQA